MNSHTGSVCHCEQRCHPERSVEADRGKGFCCLWEDWKGVLNSRGGVRKQGPGNGSRLGRREEKGGVVVSESLHVDM